MTQFEFDPFQLPYRALTVPDDVMLYVESLSSYAVVNALPPVRELLEETYGRSGLALKHVPMPSSLQHPGLARWGGTTLGMAGLAQNMLALDGLAPRVYGLACVNDKYAAQVVDYVSVGAAPPRFDELVASLHRWGIETRHKNYDYGPQNWRDGLFLDCSGYFLPPDRIARIAEDIRRTAMVKKGLPASSAYQAVPELSIPGDRPASRRLPSAVAKLVEGVADVLDIGCNLGHFTRLAATGARRRVVGVDKETANLCAMINLLLGRWQIDVVDAKLPPDAAALPLQQYDIIFCLSAVKYMGENGIPWMASVAPALWLEGHGGVPAEHYLPALHRAYRNVQRLADTTDNKIRAQFLCTDPV